MAGLSLDKDDNQVGRFLNYLVAALQEADPTIGSEAAQLLAAARQAPPEAILTSPINDLDTSGGQPADKLAVIEKVNELALQFFNAFLKAQGTFTAAGTY